MEPQIKEEVFTRIKAINKQLFEKGYDWQDIERFWKECVYDVKVMDIESLAKQGIPDTVIATNLRVGYSVVQRVSTNYWSNKMKQKNN